MVELSPGLYDEANDRGLHLFITKNEEGRDIVYLCPAPGDYLRAYGHVVDGATVVLRVPHPDGRPNAMSSEMWRFPADWGFTVGYLMVKWDSYNRYG